MENIDWSKAPEGATHYQPENEMLRAAWIKIQHGEHWFMIENLVEHQLKWVRFLGRFDHLGELIPAPQAWNGSGQAPVGTACEHRTGPEMSWSKATVLAYGDKKVFYRDQDGYEWTRLYGDIEFRAIRTPEQIAAERRQQEIDEAFNLVNKTTQVPGDFVR